MKAVDEIIASKPGNTLSYVVVMQGNEMETGGEYIVKFDVTDMSLGIIRQYFEGKAKGKKILTEHGFEVGRKFFEKTDEKLMDSLK